MGDTDLQNQFLKNSRIGERSNQSRKFKCIPVISEMREIPWHKMAQVDATILFWREISGECAGVEVIHVLVYPDI
jgi:hypothetical protein